MWTAAQQCFPLVQDHMYYVDTHRSSRASSKGPLLLLRILLASVPGPDFAITIGLSR